MIYLFTFFIVFVLLPNVHSYHVSPLPQVSILASCGKRPRSLLYLMVHCCRRRSFSHRGKDVECLVLPNGIGTVAIVVVLGCQWERCQGGKGPTPGGILARGCARCQIRMKSPRPGGGRSTSDNAATRSTTTAPPPSSQSDGSRGVFSGM
jgi:hypothetical protein